MHTAFARLNAVCAFNLSTLAALTFLCFASTFFNDYNTQVSINAANVVLKNVPDYIVSREKNDLGILKIDVTSDLEPLFNWNVKQLFLYLTAEYESKNNKLNQVVLWDKIIKRGEKALIKIKNEPLKYYFWDDGNGLLGHKNVTLYLSWNIIPNAGTLPRWVGTGTHRLTFPSEYTQMRTNF
ncbi:UNVERIFIED_CONTAM: hypothetical protein RMT77_001049 [Armadillidium vulgare]|nr:Signal peptidase complex subunit 3 [Armadillidium vulgare]